MLVLRKKIDLIFFFFFVYSFSRLYQVRCSLRVSPRLPVQVETCIPEGTGTGPSACIIGGSGASRVFQILYRNEEVSLKDIIMFRAHLLGKYIYLLMSLKCLPNLLYNKDVC